MNPNLFIESTKTAPYTGNVLLVMTEIQFSIRAALDLAETQLVTSTESAPDGMPSSVAAKKIAHYFYQARCALNWIGLDGIPTLLELMQSAATAVLDNKPAQAKELSAALYSCGQTLLAHLQAIRLGYQIPSTRLFPCYRDLYFLLKKEHVQPTGLLSLAIVEDHFSEFQLAEKHALPHKSTSDVRAEFEQALLIFLRATKDDERKISAEQISTLIFVCSKWETNRTQRLHWQVLFIFSECVIAGVLPDSGPVKKYLRQSVAIFGIATISMRHPCRSN